MKTNINVSDEVLRTLKAQITNMQAREANLIYIMSTAKVGFCYLDTKLRYTYINDWLADINGLPAEKHIGQSIRKLFPDLADSIEPQFQQVIDTGNPIIKGHVYAATLAHPGEKRLFEHNYYPNKLQDGTVIGVSCFIEDITERHQSKEELSQYHNHLEALVAERTSEIQARNLSSQIEHQLLNYIVAAEDIEQALRICLIELSEFFEYRYAEIWIPQEDTNNLKAYYQWSSVTKDLKQFADCSVGLTLEKGQDVAGSVWSTGDLEWHSNENWQSNLVIPRDKVFHRLGIKTALGVPLKTNSALMAVFCFYSPNKKEMSDENIELISAITLQAALAIDRLHVSNTFEHLIEAAPGAMLITLEDGTIKMQNNTCSRLFGYTDSELIGSAIEVLVPASLHKKHRKLRDNIRKQTLPRPMGSGLQIKGRKKDGSEIPIDVSLNLQETLFGNRYLVGISDLREHQKYIDELSASRQRLRDLTNHMTKITERERKSIARDLHDDLGQVLTSLKIDVAIVERQVHNSEDTDNSDSISEDLAAMSETLEKASERLHAFVRRLRPEILDNLGLIAALEYQAEEFFKSHRIKCDFVCALDHITINDEIAIAVYRIVQECLTNISRHSKASNSTVKLILNDNTVIIEVSDNGVGLAKDALTSTNRFGLLGIRERASALDGNVQIDSTSGEGLTIRITIPIKS